MTGDTRRLAGKRFFDPLSVRAHELLNSVYRRSVGSANDNLTQGRYLKCKSFSRRADQSIGVVHASALIIIVLALRALGIVEVVNGTARRAGSLREVIPLRLVGGKELQPLAGRAPIDIHLKSTSNKIGKISQKPAGFAKLKLFF